MNRETNAEFFWKNHRARVSLKPTKVQPFVAGIWLTNHQPPLPDPHPDPVSLIQMVLTPTLLNYVKVFQFTVYAHFSYVLPKGWLALVKIRTVRARFDTRLITVKAGHKWLSATAWCKQRPI